MREAGVLHEEAEVRRAHAYDFADFVKLSDAAENLAIRPNEKI